MPTGVTPIGLDVGRHAIKAVQCARGGAAGRIVASVSVERVDESPLPGIDEARRLAEIMWRHGFQGRRAVLGVPESSLLASVVEVPPIGSGAPVPQIAASELARLHGADLAELETDCWVLPPCGPKGQRHEAVAVGVRRAEMLSLIGALQARDGGGFEVVAADAPSCARARAAKLVAGERGTPESWAVLDLGWSASRLSVVDRGMIVYERALQDAGMAHLELRLEQECALKPEDIRHVLGRSRGGATRRVSAAWQAAVATFSGIVATEVKDSLRYLSLNRGIGIPGTVLLTGGGAECTPVLAALSEALEGARPLQVAGHEQGGRSADGRGRESPTGSGLTMALGLTQWAA